MPLPVLTWRRRSRQKSYWVTSHTLGRRASSSGRYYPAEYRIVLTAGSERRAQKLTLLHEIAHWLTPSDRGHGDAFWIKAFELYRRYGVPMRYAQQREMRYRKGAVVGIVADRARRKQPEDEWDDEWGIASAMRSFADAIDAALAGVPA